MNRVYRSLGRAYPGGYQRTIQRLVAYSGSADPTEVWLGKILFWNIIAILIATVLWPLIFPISQTLLALLIVYAVLVVIFQTASYMIPYYAGDRRAKAVESVLPNFYQLLASYMRSGMTPYQALKAASRKEFGILKDELDMATSSALGTQSFADSFLSMNSRINSDSLRRSTELMVRGIESGGSLARLLEESSANLLENRLLRREIIASSRTYTLMVIFAVVIGAPLLLSISTRFNERLIGLSSQIQTGTANIQGLQTGIFMSGGSIDPGFLFLASLFMVGATALISSFLIGIISEGKEKYGVKYALIFVPLSVGLFLLFKFALTALF